MSDLPHFYERFIEPIEARMMRSVWRITRNLPDAEDAIQNALLVICKRRHVFERHKAPHALVLNIKVFEQGLTKVNDGGRVWLDYRLAVTCEGSAKPVQFLFRVDSVTKLPAICRTSEELNGKPTLSETRFDYPERGPADIFDLGVPRTTKLVDRVTPDDLHRILETIRAGRERMGSGGPGTPYLTRYTSAGFRLQANLPGRLRPRPSSIREIQPDMTRRKQTTGGGDRTHTGLLREGTKSSASSKLLTLT
jgi:hypothetical protein